MRKLFFVIGLLTAYFFFVTDIQAITVRFDESNQGPSDSLVIGGVTITSPYGGQPTTTLGVGLGNILVGSSNSVDRQRTWEAGTYNVTEDKTEGLKLSVDGIINSITILPHISILGSDDPVELGFFIMSSLSVQYPSQFTYIGPPVSDYSPVTIPSSHSHGSYICIGNESNHEIERYEFGQYLIDHNLGGATIETGFTILSIDYTPSTVPEPATMLLLGFGLMGLARVKRYLKKSSRLQDILCL